MSYAIGDKVLFRPMGNGEDSSPYEGKVTEVACRGYVRVRITGHKWFKFHDWVNADTHVICKLTPAPKPKKVVTWSRETHYDGTRFSVRGYHGGVTAMDAGYLHASDDGGKRWFRVKLVPWDGPTDAFISSDVPDEGFVNMARALFAAPNETVEVDDE